MARNASSRSTGWESRSWRAFAGSTQSMYSCARIRKKAESRPVTKMNNTAWKAARERAADAWAKEHGEPAPAGFRNIRVHDLKHTFGRRLRAAGVSFEDRQDLLGHRSGRITTHYSQAELTSLIEAAEKVCEYRVPQKPRNHLASAQDGLAAEALTH